MFGRFLLRFCSRQLSAVLIPIEGMKRFARPPTRKQLDRSGSLLKLLVFQIPPNQARKDKPEPGQSDLPLSEAAGYGLPPSFVPNSITTQSPGSKASAIFWNRPSLV